MNTKLRLPILRRPALLALGVVVLAPGVYLSAAPATASSTNQTAKAEIALPRSVFVVPNSAKEGRNPFFPMSTPFPQAVAAPTVGKTPEPTDYQSGLVLKGIIPSGSKRSAIINGFTIEEGEEHEVKMLNGSKVLVRCDEVRADSVVVSVRSQRLELHLRSRL